MIMILAGVNIPDVWSFGAILSLCGLIQLFIILIAFSQGILKGMSCAWTFFILGIFVPGLAGNWKSNGVIQETETGFSRGFEHRIYSQNGRNSIYVKDYYFYLNT